MTLPNVSAEFHNFLCFISSTLLVFWGFRVIVKFKNLWQLWHALQQNPPRILWFNSMGLAELRDILTSLGNQLQSKHLKQLLQAALAQHDVSPLSRLHVKVHVDPKSKLNWNDGVPLLKVPLEFIEDLPPPESISVHLFFGVRKSFFAVLNRNLEVHLRQASANRRNNTSRHTARSPSLFGSGGKKKRKDGLEFDPEIMVPNDCISDSKLIITEDFHDVKIHLDEGCLEDVNAQCFFCVAMVSVTNSEQYEYTVFDANVDVHDNLVDYANAIRVKTQYVLDLDEVILSEYEGVFGCDSLDMNEQDDAACVVCFVNPKAVMLLPCRHLCVCEECLPKIDKCPLCRKPMVENVRWKSQSFWSNQKSIGVGDEDRPI